MPTQIRSRTYSRTQRLRASPKKRSIRRPLRRSDHIGTGRRLRFYHESAKARLRKFRRGSQLAVATTALLLLAWGVPTDSSAVANNGASAKAADPSLAVTEATGTLRDLLLSFYSLLPKIGIAIAIIILAMLLARALKSMLNHTLGTWGRAAAIGALSQVLIILFAVGASLSVIAGDARALVGSVGLAGLALSWALQAPIESFTGWLLNSFRSYYRVGDRIEVGEVFGDVYQIDILTTTVWEAGGENKPVRGAQPTGALITFPNSEILRSNIINYTRDFPYVWDEVTQGVANESDLHYSISVLQRVAKRVVGEAMREPAKQYLEMISRRNLPYDIATEPSVFASTADAWTNLTIRYLIPARERRHWSSALIVELAKELAMPENAGKIIPSLPRARLEITTNHVGSS
ncbi:MAG TPA: mechanosensitive ion channel protein MscS [Bdellovibrionales bacterium]|nr:MAG: mechanosensitive ion channel protein MscS [Bdellovibrionales bacterium GWB1_52_6]OFZ05585.1 MAG: mechanosensitive ion channel protein MscS [Bdellovibrionales bacterium GWA1_52_35]HAR44215.1 mechanosensitive ion channel protein MscS [Bdellovibrionales bacterium]HCM39044.1 mechanosensitive ion channel protein MscS [Bdellovibrionales bacterium]